MSCGKLYSRATISPVGVLQYVVSLYLKLTIVHMQASLFCVPITAVKIATTGMTTAYKLL